MEKLAQLVLRILDDTMVPTEVRRIAHDPFLRQAGDAALCVRVPPNFQVVVDALQQRRIRDTAQSNSTGTYQMGK